MSGALIALHAPRRKDDLLAAGYDPYRTQHHGYSAEGLALRILVALALVGMAAGLAIVFLVG